MGIFVSIVSPQSTCVILVLHLHRRIIQLNISVADFDKFILQCVHFTDGKGAALGSIPVNFLLNLCVYLTGPFQYLYPVLWQK